MANREHEPPKSGQPTDKISQIVDMARQLRTTRARLNERHCVNK
jgi:hypothetical protein